MQCIAICYYDSIIVSLYKLIDWMLVINWGMSASETLTWLETHGLVTSEQTSFVTSMLDSGQMVVLTGNCIIIIKIII